MARGRKEVVRKIIGYDLFRLSDDEVSNRLSLNYHPTTHFSHIDYIGDDNFFGYIYPKMVQLDYLSSYLDNVKHLKEVDTNPSRHNDEEVLKLLTITNRQRAICSLKAFYDNQF